MKQAIDIFWSIMEFAVPLALGLAYEARSPGSTRWGGRRTGNLGLAAFDPVIRRRSDRYLSPGEPAGLLT
jgi:hypothetical protein